MTRSDEEDETLDQIEMLTDLFEKREQLMTEFEPDVFESIVDRIVVKSRNELEFHLIGGLKLREKSKKPIEILSELWYNNCRNLKGTIAMIIKSSTVLRNDYGQISNLAHERQEPIYITKNGEGDLVVMSIESVDR